MVIGTPELVLGETGLLEATLGDECALAGSVPSMVA
jgi:hypothetical protein